MVYFSKKKIKCVGYAINQEKVRKINSGVLPLADLKNWFGFEIKKLVKQNYLKATYNYNDLITEDFLVHFVAIPTEKDGKPFYKPLLNVLTNISKINRKVKKLARRSILSKKVLNKQFIIIDKFSLESYKTKEFLSILHNLNIVGQKVTVLADIVSDNLFLGARNIKNICVIPAISASTYDLLDNNYILADLASVESLNKQLAN